MFAGTLTTSAQIAARYARLSPGTVPLAAGGTAAAFANGVAAAALDSEDGHYPGGAIHPASVVCASALASAPPHATVADLLTAQIAGFEVCLRAAATWWLDARVLLIFEGAEETLSLRVIGRTLTGAGL